MSNLATVLGIDPSLRNFGLVKAIIDLEKCVVVSIEKLRLVETESTNNKRVRKNSDDLERTRMIHKALHEELQGCVMTFVEVPVGSQSARAMMSYGACVGILASIQQPMVQLNPSEVKMAAVGDKNASKAEMIEWATAMYPNADWFPGQKKGTYGGKNEHLADAVAAIHAGLEHEDFKGYLAIMKMMRGVA